MTGKPLEVTGGIAEYEAAEKLGLELGEARTPGWDALHNNGTKIQIKGRYKRNRKKWGRMPKIYIKKELDTVMRVLMCRDYQVHEILEAERQAVIDRLMAPGAKSRDERS